MTQERADYVNRGGVQIQGVYRSPHNINKTKNEFKKPEKKNAFKYEHKN